MVTHIWKLLSLKESLWVQWIHSYKLQGRNFWDVPIREFISPLAAVITPRDVFWAGLVLSSKIRDVVQNNVWNWPPYLVSKFPFITSIDQPNLQDIPDRLEWQDGQGNDSTYFVISVWFAIRPRDVKDDWFDVIWFPNRIPRHAFHLWLIMKERLKTQDRVCSWDVSSSLSTLCP
ncbi:CASP-like protein 4A3, partial [Tanacetum coccineum]